jgi:hypothetical protein
MLWAGGFISAECYANFCRGGATVREELVF